MVNSGLRRAALGFLVTATCACLAAGSEHPGNVYVEGSNVTVPLPAPWTGWRAVDVDGNEVGRGSNQDGSAALGKLPVGYFEIRKQEGPARITAAVVAKNEPVENTPIALDAAMSWFYPDAEQIRDACTLCRLAGVKWVRDRSSWPELETARGVWAPEGRYEQAMRIEHEMGLKILQVNHISPTWASSNQARFPEDLQVVFEFYKGLAARWKGLADAIEPWNEPDIELFGGHTGCEIASFQKAAYLGLKAGDPQQPVCGTVFAIDRAETLDEFGANAVFPYFDRYDLHHYIALPAYARAYGRHRAVSGGRPLWTTEFNLPVHWADETTKEPTDDELRVQGFRVGKVFAQALFEGSEKAFYFILGDYVERNLQYGLVHRDLTPRPAYVAFAAVGRLLNGATPIGRVDFGDDKLKGYVFRTIVDGAQRETLVAWSETKPTTINVQTAETAYDSLGRELARGGKVELTRETVFIVLPRGGSQTLTTEPPPEKPARQAGAACPVVLQLAGRGDAAGSAFHLDDARELKLTAYNFGAKAAKGTLSAAGAALGASELEIEPGGRREQTIKIDGPETVTVRLDLGELGEAVVSARVTTAPLETKAAP
jgi:hypothetical protein